MKVSELIAELQQLLSTHGDVCIISSIDDEGNGYRSTRGVYPVFINQYEHPIEYVYDSISEAVDECLVNKDHLIPAVLIS